MKGKTGIPDRRSFLTSLLIISGSLAVAGMIFIGAGLAPISASASHWGITRWFLEQAMRNAVATRSHGITMPVLENEAGEVVKAAGHYASGCSPCHGAPGHKQSLTVMHMTPVAPLLAAKIREWESGELFWIVKNGLKYTAMPAWASSSRDDEVWGMVAFLTRLPAMSPQQYKLLATGSTGDNLPMKTPLQGLADRSDGILAECNRCHESDGTARRGAGVIPRLDGQNLHYLLENLAAYSESRRYSGIMQPVAAMLDRKTMTALARYYSDLSTSYSMQVVANESEIVRGRLIAEQGIPARGVPSCIHCHRAHGTPLNENYPRLSGQYADYLKSQLKLFRNQQRGGTAYAQIMQQVASGMNNEQISDVAQYYASLRWSSGK